MSPAEAHALVSSTTRVRLTSADGTEKASGHMIAYSIVPQVLVETETGERVWWRVDMAEAVKPEETPVYVIETSRGFTASLTSDNIGALVTLGLIEHDRDGHVLEDGHGNGVGPVHHFYRKASQ